MPHCRSAQQRRFPESFVREIEEVKQLHPARSCLARRIRYCFVVDERSLVGRVTVEKISEVFSPNQLRGNIGASIRTMNLA